MPLIQPRSKLNHFLVGSKESSHRVNPSSMLASTLVHTNSGRGWHLSRINDSTMIYVYHMEKARAPRIRVANQAPKPKKERSAKAKKVAPPQNKWKTRLFAFPANRVISVQQFARHFKIVLTP